MEKQQTIEGAERSTSKAELAKKVSAENPKAMADVVKADPKAEGLFSRIVSWAKKGAVDGAISAAKWVKDVFVWTGEFIGVWAAKLIHEGSDSFLQYSVEKTEGIRAIVNIAGEAIAITAYEALNSDRSVVMDAVAYWKREGVEVSKLPAEKQAELFTKYATQIGLGIVWSKGLGALSRTGAAARNIDAVGNAAKSAETILDVAARRKAMLEAAWKAKSAAAVEAAWNAASATVKKAGVVMEKGVKAGAKISVAAAGLDSNALQARKPKVKVVAEAANDELFHAEKLRSNGTTGGAHVESSSGRRVSIRPGTSEYEAYRREAAKHGITVAEAKPASPRTEPKLAPKPSEPIDFTAERAARAAEKLEASRKLAQDRLLDGGPVFVKRTNGEISVGRVTRITEDGKVDVAFSGKNGASLHKTVDSAEFSRLNDPEARLAPEIGRDQIRMRDRMKTQAERSGKGIEASNAEVFRNASASATERLSRAAEELWFAQPLTQKQADALLKAHAVKADGEGAFNFWTKSLGTKLKILQNEGGFTNDQARLLVRKGFAGEVPQAMRTPKELKTLLSGSDTEAQLSFLKTAHPDEVSSALNFGHFNEDVLEPEFVRALNNISDIRSKNLSNLPGVSDKLRAEVGALPKDVPAEQRAALSAYVDRITASAGPSFRDALGKAPSSSALASAVEALPASVVGKEAFEAMGPAISRLSKTPANHPDLVRALDSFAAKFPNHANDALMSMVEHAGPDSWGASKLLKGQLGLSVEGTEFNGLIKRLAKENPAQLKAILESPVLGSNYQLAGLKRAALRERPFNLNQFRDDFAFAPDNDRLSMLLAEHESTKWLNVAEISFRLGSENLDRFFHAGGLDRLQKEAFRNPELAERIKRMLGHYGRNESGMTKEFAAERAHEAANPVAKPGKVEKQGIGDMILFDERFMTPENCLSQLEGLQKHLDLKELVGNFRWLTEFSKSLERFSKYVVGNAEKFTPNVAEDAFNEARSLRSGVRRMIESSKLDVFDTAPLMRTLETDVNEALNVLRSRYVRN